MSGGKNAWRFWDAIKYTQGNGILLNGIGSEVKGTLLFHAIENSLSLIRSNYITSKPFEIVADSLLMQEFDTASADSFNAYKNLNQQNDKAIFEENKIIKIKRKKLIPLFTLSKRMRCWEPLL